MTRVFRLFKFRFHCFSKTNAEVVNGFLLLAIFVVWLFQFVFMLHLDMVEFPNPNLAKSNLSEYLTAYQKAEEQMGLNWFVYFITESVATFIMGLYIYISSRKTRFAGSATFLLFFVMVNMIGNFGDRIEKSMAYQATWWTFLIIGAGLTALHLRSAIRYAQK